MNWTIADARKRPDNVISLALTEGPQRITHGGRVLVVLAEVDYLRLTDQRETFIEYILRGLDLSDLDLTRDPSPMRGVCL